MNKENQVNLNIRVTLAQKRQWDMLLASEQFYAQGLLIHLMDFYEENNQLIKDAKSGRRVITKDTFFGALQYENKE
mgnify:CR=1 FL=1|jgi:hypothetical protein